MTPETLDVIFDFELDGAGSATWTVWSPSYGVIAVTDNLATATYAAEKFRAEYRAAA